MVRERPAGDPAQGAEAGGVMEAGEGANDVADANEVAVDEPELFGGARAAAV